MPGFSTIQLDLDKGIAENLVLTSLDITKSYGLDHIPAFGSLPVYTLKYADYGITDLSPAKLYQAWSTIENSTTQVENYLADRVGFVAANSTMRERGVHLE